MLFDLNKCVNYISANITKKISEKFGDWLRHESITRIQWIALYFIYINESLSQRNLAQMMQINDSSAMRLIDRLERDGLVERLRNNTDRRIIQIILTQKGTETISRLLHIGEEFSQTMIKDISASDLKIFQNVQIKMLDNIMNDERSQK